ncbi:GNAT family N-acetyltransferase [Sedimentibacter sp. zth1]|uniref:GNAT family N-acetyltransferase n=1 Tax=Sedimentibacter sp. zth1 TaxID=2816908 RepID=UPI001A92B0BC|nr:GNAT family protein [Sedimentibacter sp. zth1]QSX04639.1 GNAT family N-acetyltransferase [Sedimentibacter sp. zth1]
MFKCVIDSDIEVRLIESKYAKELFDVISANKSHLRKWLSWVDTNRFEDTKAFVEASMKQFASNDGFQAVIFYRKKLAGAIGYHKIDWIRKSTSIGYWLAEKYVGKGIMTKVCRKFVDYALEDLDLNRIEIRCAEKNLKSRAIPERLGFTNEGTIRDAEFLNGVFVNHVVYGILKSEWK